MGGRGDRGEGMLMLERARTLRLNQTEAEQRLWYYLRAHRFMGLKFKRQKPIGNYIVDFICLSPKLVIEIDGSQHAEQADYDHCRDTWLREQGFLVLRFWNNEVLNQTEGVLESIRQAILALSPDPSPPTPLPLVGEGSNPG
jgi:very-short-patch-repair endonuclease